MAWENHIIGYKIVSFGKNATIPADAKFIHTKEVFEGMAGWISNLQPVYKTMYEYQIPVYKKVRVKKKIKS